jgi:hypothetical protein
VEERDAGHGRVWVVVRKEVPPPGAAPVAAYRCHTTAGLTAAVLPALSVPNHLRLGERKPTGIPLHDGDHFLGHLSPHGPAAHPDLPHYLHAARHLAIHPESLVHLLRTNDPEALAIMGRGLARAP